MNRTLLSIALISVVSANSYALEIINGKILEHKEWTDGKITATYLHSAKNLLPLHQPNASFKNEQATPFSVAQVMSGIDSQENTVGLQSVIQGFHNINIYNDTKDIKKYNYNLSTCIKNSPKEFLCAYYFDNVELKPGGSIKGTVEPQVKYVFDKAGTYSINASTYLNAYDDKHNDILGSNSTSNIIIKNK